MRQSLWASEKIRPQERGCLLIVEIYFLRRPHGAKSAKNEHAQSKRKEHALRANVKATTDFVAATLKNAEQIAFSLFTVEDKNIHVTLLDSGSTSAGPKSLQSSRHRLLPRKLPKLLPPTSLLLLGFESPTRLLHLHLSQHKG